MLHVFFSNVQSSQNYIVFTFVSLFLCFWTPINFQSMPSHRRTATAPQPPLTQEDEYININVANSDSSNPPAHPTDHAEQGN